MLATGLSYISLTMLTYVPSIPGFFRNLIINRCRILSKAFLYVLRSSCDFSPLFCLPAVLHWLIYVCWTNLASLEWNQLDLSGWYMIFLMCCWIWLASWKFLCLCSSRKLFYNMFIVSISVSIFIISSNVLLLSLVCSWFAKSLGSVNF
jgi:hypothetical protein